MIEYEHEQTGTLMRVAFGTSMVCFGVMMVAGLFKDQHELAMVGGFSVAVLAIILSQFHSLTVRVTQHDIRIAFGVGLIRKRFLISDVMSVTTVTNRWFFGWGIRWIPGGWLYNVSGFDAVEISMQNGRRYRIGTDQPQDLLAAIESQKQNAG